MDLNKIKEMILPNGKKIIKLEYLGKIIWQAIRRFLATVTGVFPLNLENSTGENLEDYKIYGNSIQNGNPTPEIPIEVESVGDKSKNLIPDFGNAYYSYKSGGLLPNETGTAGYRGTLKKWTIKPNESYTLSISNNVLTDPWLYFVMWKENGEFISSKNQYTNSLVFTNNYSYNIVISVGIWYNDGSSKPLSDFGNLQLEEGSEATDYEPYGYKVPVKVITSELPEQYTQLEYIESTGTQYINTKITGDANVELEVQGTKVSSRTQILIGYGTLGYAGTWLGISNSVYTAGTGAITTIEYTKRIKANIIFKSNPMSISFTINGQNYSRTGSGNNSYNMFLGNPSSGYPCEAKFYSCKIYQNDIMVRNLIPCYRKSDNTIGMYDTVTNTFFTNAGTGTFVAGSEHSKIFNIYLNEPLRKIGDYEDYIDFKNKKVVRNIMEETIDAGAIYYGKYGNFNYSLFYIDKEPIILHGKDGIPLVLSNEYKTYILETGNPGAMPLFHIRGQFGGTRIYWNDNRFENANDMNNWLALNPMQIQYILANQTEETIELPDIPLQQGDNIISVETKIQPSKGELEYWRCKI